MSHKQHRQVATEWMLLVDLHGELCPQFTARKIDVTIAPVCSMLPLFERCNRYVLSTLVTANRHNCYIHKSSVMSVFI